MANKKELKGKGVRLLSDGCVLGDTSGRTRILNEKSVFALASKKFGFTVLITSSEKKKIFGKLRKKKPYSESRLYAVMHAVKLYYALNNYISTCPAFYICCDGHNPGLLKHYLQQFLKARYHNKKINIERSLSPMFGHKNIADRLAWAVNKKGKKPTMVLAEKHFKQLNLI